MRCIDISQEKSLKDVSREKSLKNITLLFTVLLFTIGCGGSDNPKPDGLPDLFACTISITQEGSALTDAEVILVPVDGATDWRARGVTDAAGNAKIVTYGTHQGAPKGKYKVVVTKMETEPSKFTRPENEADYAAMAVYEKNVQNEQLDTYTFVESVYSNADTTTLELEITGRTTQTFDVGKKVRELLPQ